MRIILFTFVIIILLFIVMILVFNFDLRIVYNFIEYTFSDFRCDGTEFQSDHHKWVIIRSLISYHFKLCNLIKAIYLVLNKRFNT